MKSKKHTRCKYVIRVILGHFVLGELHIQKPETTRGSQSKLYPSVAGAHRQAGEIQRQSPSVVSNLPPVFGALVQ
jgi:hypothetical protein